jgi:hypothetical protein
MTKPPSPPYLGPPFRQSGNDNKPINRIVIHSTVSPCEPGGARNIAAYFRSSSAGGSAHYITDPEETVQSAWDSVVCWHAPPNSHSLGIEMCDMPGPVPSGTKEHIQNLMKSWRWTKLNQRKMLHRTARLTAQLCLAYNVPIQFLQPEGLRAGKRGITTHNNVSRAWHQSSHWDPGFWPRRKFIRLVKSYAKQIKRTSQG